MLTEETTIVYNLTWPEWWQIGLWIVAAMAYWDLVKYLGRKFREHAPDKIRIQHSAWPERGSRHRASPPRRMSARGLGLLDLRGTARERAEGESDVPYVPAKPEDESDDSLHRP